MARISTYAVSTPATIDDKLVGSDSVNATKNFTVGSIIDLAGITAGTANTLAMFGSGSALVNSIVTQNAAGTTISIGSDDSQEVTTEATLNIQGPVKDSTGTLGGNEQVLVSNAAGSLSWENYQGSGLEYQAAWNASTNVPDLTAIVLDDTNTGKYWVVSTAGNTNLGGITDWNPGDWAIVSQNDAGTIFWDQIDNSGIAGIGVTDRLTIWTSATTLGSAPVKLGSGTDSLVFNNISNNLASGNNSFSSGFTTQASGGASTAMGHSTVASGIQSTALGFSSDATGDVSTAIGNNALASGISSVALGFNTTANGNTSIAAGNSTVASGVASTALGLYSAASGVASTATGYDTDASGANSTSTGKETTASGVNSTAMGLQTTADGFGTTAVGSYNTIDPAAVPTGFNAANRAFVVGIGVPISGVVTREDAFTVKYDGTTYTTHEAKFNKNVIVDDKIGIRIANPQRELDVDGGVRIRDTLDLFQGNDNTFAGTDAGNLSNIAAGSNTGFGKNSQANSVTGSDNTSVGFETLGVLVTGNQNTAIGSRSMELSNGGDRNVAVGSGSLSAAINGNGNTAIGHNSLQNKTTANFNTAVGVDALGNITTGFRNTAVGNEAGKFNYQGTTSNTTGNNSVFIGDSAKPQLNGQTNQIVIGSAAIGNGQNTVTIGNSSIVKTILKGSVGVGTDDPQSKLQVDGGIQLANDSDAASALKVGTFRYRTSGNNSYVDMCMQTGATTYAWVNILQNNW
tara:strand:+ start:267 stop:2498 length:2232 start_codon:yes stop_codon:yes gene_type:complete